MFLKLNIINLLVLFIIIFGYFLSELMAIVKKGLALSPYWCTFPTNQASRACGTEMLFSIENFSCLQGQTWKKEGLFFLPVFSNTYSLLLPLLGQNLKKNKKIIRKKKPRFLSYHHCVHI